MKKLFIFIYAVSIFLASDVVPAQSFSDAMPDVPIMAGLEAMPDRTIMFDKAQGRIIQMAYSLGSLSSADVFDYYSKTLPQLGWVRVPHEETLFERDGEVLRLTIENQPSPGVVLFSISPKS